MENLIKPYEISLWRDVLTFVYTNGKESEDVIVNGYGAVAAQYYKEQKVCVIGGSDFDSPNRAVNPKLVTKINGENILTFDMYLSYYDTETGEWCYNPYVKKIANETKIKLRYGDPNNPSDVKWYDFLIKNIQESSEKRIISYTAKDLFICELSKSGTNLTFDVELENNIGNINTLGERVLEGSDWQIKDSGIVLREKIDEPLYLAKTKYSISVKLVDQQEKEVVEEIPAGEYVYLLYTDWEEKNEGIQLIYSSNYTPSDVKKLYPRNDNHIIINCNTYEHTVPDTSFETYGSEFDGVTLASDYRGYRFIKKPKVKFDSKLNRYVNVYTKWDEKNKKDKEYYGFVETEYISPVSVKSYITNPREYTSTIGWEVSSNETLKLVTVPDLREAEYNEEGIIENLNCCLKTNAVCVYNSGIIDYRNEINGFQKGDKYVFGARIGRANKNAMGEYGPKELTYEKLLGLSITISKYEIKDGKIEISLKEGEHYFNAWMTEDDYNGLEGYYYSIIECSKTLTYGEMAKMTNSLGLFLWNPYADPSHEDKDIYIQDVVFYPYVKKEDSKQGEVNFWKPGDNFEAKTLTKYCYFDPTKKYTSREDLELADYSDSEIKSYKSVYNNSEDSFEKVRTLSATDSNRFNLIQSLCETFESWVNFEIEHSEDGRILLGKDKLWSDLEEAEEQKYRQQKWVSFQDYVKKENYAGFKYGINLKNISRTIESEAIVSKLNVKDNSNEFATDGFCSIARSPENPNLDNFILDFSYYVQSGLISYTALTNDLYLDTSGYLGYYVKLKELNKKRDNLAIEKDQVENDLVHYEADLTTLKTELEATESELAEWLRDFKIHTGSEKGYSSDFLEKNEKHKNNDKTLEIITSIEILTKKKKRLESQVSDAKALYDSANERQETVDVELQQNLDNKKILNTTFYKKYSRFLQEGNWISEDYIDDSLYFFDAQSTLHTSSQPKVAYEIDAIEISSIEGYEGYNFKLGDETTIEDPEFFGWVFEEGGTKRPYRERIVITELTFSLDHPEENKIKVKNYQDAFEDLFQRIAATTQSIEFSQGDYARAAAIVQPNGTINVNVLQNSLTNNAIALQNVKEQSVTWDERGIIVTSSQYPAEMVRIINGGIYLTDNGGVTWTTGITGGGINASCLVSGQVSTDRITISGGSGFNSFRWDKLGISAYKFDVNENNGLPYNFNFSKFVRLDQYGLYGINGIENFNATIPDDKGRKGEEKIWHNANFALTWKGFMLKSSHKDGGYISITSDNDFEVKDDVSKTRVKIGRLGEDDVRNPIYGIQVNGADGNPVIEQGSDGNVWIKNVLNVSGKLTINTLSGNKVNVGYLNNKKIDTDIHEIINANDKFIVYEDGSVKATDGYFEGKINATSGTFTGEIKATSGEFSGQIDIGDKVSIGLLLDGSRIVEITQEGETDTKEVTYKQVINANNKFIVYEDGYIEAVNGHFEGEINATSGRFSGVINATSGEIGGFFITNNQLSSLNGAIILDSKYETIYVKNITLGEGAKIEKNIILGSAKIWNPDWKPPEERDSIFIEAGKLTVKTTGFLNLGNIEAYGGNDDPDNFSEAYIRAINDKWEIRGDGRAIFKDIHADNVHLQNTILEINTVQAMGSLMLFKDAWTAILITEEEYDVNFNQREDASLIKLLEETAEEYEYLKIKERTNLANGDWIYIGEEVYKIEETFTTTTQDSAFTFLKIIGKIPLKENVINESAYLISEDVIDEEVSNKEEEYIISKFGKPNEDYIFSALGSKQEVTVYDTKFATSNSLTIASFKENENGTGLEYSKNLVLGDLSQVKMTSEISLTGFGLYSDNVFLRGSLVTEGSNKFAGVNTNSNVVIQEGEKNYGNIVFWAGAESYSNDSIIASPFYVTDMGLLYAKQAIFEDSIFTNGVIEGVTIKTAKLMGKGDALKIYDGSSGISFIKEEKSNETDEEELFRIATEGFIKKTNTKDVDFVSIQEKAVGFKAFSSDSYGMGYLETTPMSSNFELKHYQEESDKVTNYGKIAFRISGLFLGYNNTPSMMWLAKDSINFYSDSHFDKKIFLGNNVEYRPVEQGYELYIIDED